MAQEIVWILFEQQCYYSHPPLQGVKGIVQEGNLCLCCVFLLEDHWICLEIRSSLHKISFLYQQ